MRYEIFIQFHTAYAKNKATCYESGRKGSWVVCEAFDDESAYNILLRTVRPFDKRPIAGKSYIRKCRVEADNRHAMGGNCPYEDLPSYKVGDKVELHTPYASLSGYVSFHHGIIVEVQPTLYAVQFAGYHTPVDFTRRELALSVPTLHTLGW